MAKKNIIFRWWVFVKARTLRNWRIVFSFLYLFFFLPSIQIYCTLTFYYSHAADRSTSVSVVKNLDKINYWPVYCVHVKTFKTRKRKSAREKVKRAKNRPRTANWIVYVMFLTIGQKKRSEGFFNRTVYARFGELKLTFCWHCLEGREIKTFFPSTNTAAASALGVSGGGGGSATAQRSKVRLDAVELQHTPINSDSFLYNSRNFRRLQF